MLTRDELALRIQWLSRWERMPADLYPHLPDTPNEDEIVARLRELALQLPQAPPPTRGVEGITLAGPTYS
eukprot:11136189-Alexandrium_andersonii.AAC.1